MRASSRRTSRVAIGLTVVLAALVACYPGDQLTIGDADVVVTLFDDGADFASKRSYAMPDSIAHIVAGGAADDVRRDFDAQILARVASNLGAIGFTRENDPADGDVLVLVAVTAGIQMGLSEHSWAGHWGWYFPYPAGWAWGWYPWYPGDGALYRYDTGSILVQMIDPAGADSTASKVPTIWLGALNGLIDRDAVEERVLERVDRAFEQSPYLGAGK